MLPEASEQYHYVDLFHGHHIFSLLMMQLAKEENMMSNQFFMLKILIINTEKF